MSQARNIIITEANIGPDASSTAPSLTDRSSPPISLHRLAGFSPITAKSNVAGRIRFCQQLRAYFLNVLEMAEKRQEVGRKLASGC